MFDSAKFRSKTQLILFIIYAAVLVILLLNLFRIIDFYDHSISESNSETVYYTLDWQNQAGTPFSITDLSTYQFFDIHLEITSDFGFAQNTNITLFAYGTMSESFFNSSLAYIQISYDGAIAYPSNQGYIAGPHLRLEIWPEGRGGIALGDTVYVISEPISITWAFSGGPHYPTVNIDYWNGGSLNEKFLSAPVTIVPPPPSQPLHDTPEQIALSWGIGSAFVVIAEVIYLRYPRKEHHVPLK